MEKELRNTNPDGTPVLDTVNKMERLYQVPLFYFEGLADEIMGKITPEAFTGNMGYQVPEDYFSGLAGQIMSRIHQTEKTGSAGSGNFGKPDVYQELEVVAPLLHRIGNQNVYTVPEGYFDDLRPLTAASSGLAESETVTQGGKVVPMKPRKNIWRTAVAAAAILVVLFSGERFFTHHHDGNLPRATNNQFAAKINTDSDNYRSGLSEISDAEIIGYLSTPDPSLRDTMSEQTAAETQKAISNMTNEELENYLDRTPATY